MQRVIQLLNTIPNQLVKAHSNNPFKISPNKHLSTDKFHCQEVREQSERNTEI